MPTLRRNEDESDDPLLEMEADLLLLEEQFDLLLADQDMNFDSRGNSWPDCSADEVVEAETIMNEFKDNLLRVRGLMPWPITCNTEITLS